MLFFLSCVSTSVHIIYMCVHIYCIVSDNVIMKMYHRFLYIYVYVHCYIYISPITMRSSKVCGLIFYIYQTLTTAMQMLCFYYYYRFFNTRICIYIINSSDNVTMKMYIYINRSEICFQFLCVFAGATRHKHRERTWIGCMYSCYQLRSGPKEARTYGFIRLMSEW